MSPSKEIKDRIDDYVDTIYAIVGFLNFYRYDDLTNSMSDGVIVFQGRRFTPSFEKRETPEGNIIEHVTPDFGVFHKPGRNVLGEAKKSFPRERKLWIEDLKQLLSYDDDLTGWPCEGERVDMHDVVLLVHQSRAPAICDFYQEQERVGEIRFVRPFSIFSFNRSDERQPYLHFEKRFGNLSDAVLRERLRLGVSVPMQVLVNEYSTVKLYDAMPPLPYLASVIWEHVVVPRASDDPKFRMLNRKQKIEINLTIDDLVEELSEGFSFHSLSPDHPERQPKVPTKDWCRRACDSLVKAGMARWNDVDLRDNITILFTKLDNVLDHMAEVCKEDDKSERQLSLF